MFVIGVIVESVPKERYYINYLLERKSQLNVDGIDFSCAKGN